MLISILGIGWFCYLFVRYKVCLKGEVYCMKKIKKENGITLVALVITIILLLILAGVAISSITNTGLSAKR